MHSSYGTSRIRAALRVTAGVLMLAVTMAGAHPAMAQSIAAPAADVAPRRIVIAPALTEVARALKARLVNERRSETPGAQERYYFYGSRGFEPIWIQRFGRGEWAETTAATRIGQLLAEASFWGLNPADYQRPTASPADVEAAAEFELSTTSAALLFGQHNFGGRVAPRSVSELLDMDQPKLDTITLLEELAASPDPRAVLEELAPNDVEFVALKQRLASLDEEAPFFEIPPGDSLKPGARDPRVVQLRERLVLTQPTEDADVYDTALVKAVEEFQLQVGLTDDGIVGNVTRLALNRSAGVTREQIVANMEKWRWLPRNLSAFFVQVNIPEYRLWIKKDGVPVYETRVVVGTPKNQTPVFYDLIRHVVVNPYWNVPASIARNEIGPQVIRDPSYLDRKEMELMSEGKVLDPYNVNWGSVRSGSFPFQVRQKPGRQNALGQVKFLFPNKHDVYLHDTPEKSLFGADLRAFSHGCVRVQNPLEFADAMLANEPGLDAKRLEASFGPKEKWFNMKVKVPVFLTYFTLRVDEDGSLRSYEDIYGHDKRIAAALAGGDQR